jgi:hypothetical protein
MLRIRQLSLALVGLLSCLSSVEVTYAQGGGGRGQGPGRGPQSRMRFELATLPEVQSELKLTDEQKKLASEQLAKLREKQAAMAPGGGGGGAGAGGGASMLAEMQKMRAELDAAFSAKLDDAQKTRMNGLIAQVNGAASLMDSEVAKALEITDEQTAKLKAANEANQAARLEAVQKAMQNGQNMSREERAEAMNKMATEQNKTLLAVLTETQTKKLETLKGAALTIDMAPLRPARRQ